MCSPTSQPPMNKRNRERDQHWLTRSMFTTEAKMAADNGLTSWTTSRTKKFVSTETAPQKADPKIRPGQYDNRPENIGKQPKSRKATETQRPCPDLKGFCIKNTENNRNPGTLPRPKRFVLYQRPYRIYHIATSLIWNEGTSPTSQNNH